MKQVVANGCDGHGGAGHEQGGRDDDGDQPRQAVGHEFGHDPDRPVTRRYGQVTTGTGGQQTLDPQPTGEDRPSWGHVKGSRVGAVNTTAVVAEEDLVDAKVD